jgi:hypothetical protein
MRHAKVELCRTTQEISLAARVDKRGAGSKYDGLLRARGGASMSQPKFNHRWLDAPPELLRMGDLEPDDAYRVCRPIFAWKAIEVKASAGLQHRNLDAGARHVSGRQLARFMALKFEPSMGEEFDTEQMEDLLVSWSRTNEFVKSADR